MRDEARVLHRRQVHEEDPVLEAVDELGGGLDRQPRLARAARPGEGHEPNARRAQHRDDLVELGAPADQRRRGSRQVAPGAQFGRLDQQRGIVVEDRLLQAAQLGAGLGPELVEQGAPRGAVGLQRIGLAPAAIQREHELASEPLAQRLRGDEDLELGDELLRAAEGEVGLDAVLERGDAQLLQARAGELRERL
jgi:hypothetical protein